MGKLVEVLVRGKITRYSFFPPKFARCGKRKVTGLSGGSRVTAVIATHAIKLRARRSEGRKTQTPTPASWGAAVLRPYTDVSCCDSAYFSAAEGVAEGGGDGAVDADHSEGSGGGDVFFEVIDIYSFVGLHFGGAEGFLVDDWVGLAGADHAGVDADGEVIEEGESRFHVGYVNGVGVGEQRESIVFGEASPEGVGLECLGEQGGVPGLDELVVGQIAAEAADDVEVPVAGADAAILQIEEARIFFDGGPDFFG